MNFLLDSVKYVHWLVQWIEHCLMLIVSCLANTGAYPALVDCVFCDLQVKLLANNIKPSKIQIGIFFLPFTVLMIK